MILTLYIWFAAPITGFGSVTYVLATLWHTNLTCEGFALLSVCVMYDHDASRMTLQLFVCLPPHLPLSLFSSCFPFLIKKQVRDFLCHQPITLCTEFVQNFSAFSGMLLVVVGYHLMLDGPHALRCVLSNVRCFMRSIYLCTST